VTAPPQCARPGCGTAPARGRPLCAADWKRLPKRLRAAALEALASAGATPGEVLAYIERAHAEEEAAAGREADLWRRQGALF